MLHSNVNDKIVKNSEIDARANVEAVREAKMSVLGAVAAAKWR